MTQSNDQTPTDQKPEDKKPDDQKPDDQKPDDQKPEDQKPEDKKSDYDKSTDQKKPDKKDTMLAGDDGDDGDDSADDADGPPETYEFEFPEGVQPDTALLEKAFPVFQELGLTQKQGQKIVDLYMEKQGADAESLVKTLQSQAEEIKNHPDLGGENFKRTKLRCVAALEKFASPELRDFLYDSGLANNLLLVRTFEKIGAAIGEDSISGEGRTGRDGAETSEEEALRKRYPKMHEKQTD